MLILRLFIRFILVSLTLLIVSPAHAAIVHFVDNGPYTTDTFSGLDWLDITESTGRSYNDVTAQFGLGGDYEGWRYATVVQVNQFWENAGGTGPFHGDVIGQQSWIAGILGLWGITAAGGVGNQVYAMTGSKAPTTGCSFICSPDSYYVSRLSDNHFPPFNIFRQAASAFYDKRASEGEVTRGSALVRDAVIAPVPAAVPVPAAIWLFGTALIGLIGFGKRKSKVAV
jgi:hypothetical protein